MASTQFSPQNFDYVVVGAGTAGAALAARLSEDPNMTVGLIEAGEHVTDMMSIFVPGMARMAHGNPRVDWSYYTVPQTHAHDRKIFEPRGKLVGGSSALNYMAWGRASKAEYDALEALGNPGWNWEQFLPYLIKVENRIPPTEDSAKIYHTSGYTSALHGQVGPIKSSFAHWYNDLHVPFLESVANLGVPISPDTGNGSNYGAFTGAFTVDPETSTRSFAATGYYAPNADRKNLVLISQSHATRVIFERASDGDYVAKGVEVIKDGNKVIVEATREVILSAGSYQTPQLLELSGIGKREILDKHGITQILELNVGENLREHNPFAYDHPWAPFCFEVSKDYETLDVLANPERLNKEIQLYQEKKRGMMSSVFSAFAFVPLSKAYGSEAEYDAFKKRVLSDKTLTGTEAEKKEFEFLKQWLADPKRAHVELMQIPGFFSINPDFKPEAPGKHYNTMMVGCLQPLSRGSVHIVSADPLAAPAIDPAYLSNPIDVDIVVAGLKFCRRMIATPPYSDAKCVAYDPPASMETDEQLAEFVRAKMEPFYHPISTAAMLPREHGGVVDPNLKVYGTKNLRVADASVIPLMLSAHIQATVYAIAEKCADIIKAAHA